MFLATGLSVALAAPFLTLFLSTAVNASPVQISLFLVAQPVCGMGASTVLGRLSDGRFQRRFVLMASAAAGCTGAVSFAFIRTYWVLLLIGCTVSAFGGALMSQGFAYSRVLLAGDPRAPMLTSTLRTFFSIAWVAGPPLAAVLLTAGGFTSMFLGSAALYAVVVAVAAFWLSNPHTKSRPMGATDTPITAAQDAGPRALWLTLVGLALVMCSMTLNVQALPLHIQRDLHGSVRAAGAILGLCAALEIPAMLGFGWLTTRYRLRTLVRFGPVFGAAYFVLAATAQHVWQLAAAQLLNACYIAVIGGLAISYVQELLPSQPGRASTLYGNTFASGSILASPLLGLSAKFGYRIPYVAGICLAVIGLALIVAGGGPPSTRPAASVAGRSSARRTTDQ